MDVEVGDDQLLGLPQESGLITPHPVADQVIVTQATSMDIDLGEDDVDLTGHSGAIFPISPTREDKRSTKLVNQSTPSHTPSVEDQERERWILKNRDRDDGRYFALSKIRARNRFPPQDQWKPLPAEAQHMETRPCHNSLSITHKLTCGHYIVAASPDTPKQETKATRCRTNCQGWQACLDPALREALKRRKISLAEEKAGFDGRGHFFCQVCTGKPATQLPEGHKLFETVPAYIEAGGFGGVVIAVRDAIDETTVENMKIWRQRKNAREEEQKQNVRPKKQPVSLLKRAGTNPIGPPAFQPIGTPRPRSADSGAQYHHSTGPGVRGVKRVRSNEEFKGVPKGPKADVEKVIKSITEKVLIETLGWGSRAPLSKTARFSMDSVGPQQPTYNRSPPPAPRKPTPDRSQHASLRPNQLPSYPGAPRPAPGSTPSFPAGHGRGRGRGLYPSALGPRANRNRSHPVQSPRPLPDPVPTAPYNAPTGPRALNARAPTRLQLNNAVSQRTQGRGHQVSFKNPHL